LGSTLPPNFRFLPPPRTTSFLRIDPPLLEPVFFTFFAPPLSLSLGSAPATDPLLTISPLLGSFYIAVYSYLTSRREYTKTIEPTVELSPHKLIRSVGLLGPYIFGILLLSFFSFLLSGVELPCPSYRRRGRNQIRRQKNSVPLPKHIPSSVSSHCLFYSDPQTIPLQSPNSKVPEWGKSRLWHWFKDRPGIGLPNAHGKCVEVDSGGDIR
jgi:hypothetical protein